MNGANDDAFRSPRLFQSAQFEEEWKIYADILNRTNITRHTRWLDTRGNHGNLSLTLSLLVLSFEWIRHLHGSGSGLDEEFLPVITELLPRFDGTRPVLLKHLFPSGTSAYRFLPVDPSHRGRRHVLLRQCGHVCETRTRSTVQYQRTRQQGQLNTLLDC